MGTTSQRFGEALRAGRKAKGLSQAALASELGTTQSYISGLESGKHLPGLDLFGRLTWVLDLEPASVLAALLPEDDETSGFCVHTVPLRQTCRDCWRLAWSYGLVKTPEPEGEAA